MFLHLTVLLALLPGAASAKPGFGISFGLIDFTRELEAFELGVEYRFPDWRYGLVPHVGVQVTEDEAFYGYGGLRRPFQLGESRWDVIPSFAVSLYEQGDGQDLGNVIEFRSGIDVRYRFEKKGALALGFYHLSNASISSTNPGTNSLLLRIELP
ncbi:MAG: acyloxyacyl hydrolase [Acidobacteriota bacterium]